MDESVIYEIRCRTTNKLYIGSTSNWMERRSRHIRDLNGGTHCNPHLQRAWDKYGSVAFDFYVIEGGIHDLDLLLGREQFWIDFWDSTNPLFGFNLCPVAGSRKGSKWSDVSRNNKKGKYKGEKSWWWGKHHSKSTKQKMSNSHKNKTFSKETRRKISIAKKGTKRSKESVNKSADSCAKDWLLISPQGMEYQVHNLAKFCREHSLAASHLSAVACGKRLQHKGWKCAVMK